VKTWRKLYDPETESGFQTQDRKEHAAYAATLRLTIAPQHREERVLHFCSRRQLVGKARERR
jgi:hypothetical protein